MNPMDKPLVSLHGQVRTLPFSAEARVEAGYLLRRVQRGEIPGMPHARPMPSIGARCYELRIADRDAAWRIMFRADHDAVVILEVFRRTTARTPKHVIETCRTRLRDYDAT